MSTEKLTGFSSKIIGDIKSALEMALDHMDGCTCEFGPHYEDDTGAYIHDENCMSWDWLHVEYVYDEFIKIIGDHEPYRENKADIE